jgi:hypothetical protein
MLAGRFRMDVSGYGELLPLDATVNGWWFAPVSGQAGVDVCYCYMSCASWDHACGTILNPELLEFSLLPGQSSQAPVHAQMRWIWQTGQYCPASFESDRPWLGVQVLSQDEEEAHLLVTVDTDGLSEGMHEGHMIAVSECRDCVAVRLTVQPITAVPDQGPQTLRQNWGRIKNAYR